MTFHYETNCTLLDRSDVGALHTMIDAAEDVTLATVRRHCDLAGLLDDLGYAVGSEQGLHIKDDWHVTYHKSQFRGRPCYYVRHSAIEHIFLEAAAMIYKVEVQADSSGEWVGNGLTFETERDAVAYARDLAYRWLSVRDWRVVKEAAA